MKNLKMTPIIAISTPSSYNNRQNLPEKHSSLDLSSLVDLIQNATIEERVALLEIQVVEIQDDVTGLEVDLTELEGYVDFLFDETVIQDERLLNLEQETEEIEEQLVVIDDNVESKFDKIDTRISMNGPIRYRSN